MPRQPLRRPAPTKECLCSQCLRPVTLECDSYTGEQRVENACPHCRADVCGCEGCLNVLAALRRGVRDHAMLGISKPLLDWTEAEGATFPRPRRSMH